MSYIALYRKYRPKCFSEVVGQDTVVNILKNSIKNNKIGHAYIFSGTKGTGKTSVAKIFAKAINCLHPVDGDICNECETCINLNNDSIDIIEIDAASNNGVEEIREIRNNVKVLPNYCRYKVYIIDEVHMLSTSAFNALLKTLEEPPEHVVFILATTELNKIPATVLSRCQKLDFKKISKYSLVKQLKFILKSENKELSDGVVDLIADLSDGAFRDAINLMDQLLTLNKKDITQADLFNIVGIISDDIAFDLIRYIINSDIKNGLKLIDKLFNDGINFYKVCEKLQYIITDITIYNTTESYYDEDYENILSEFSFQDINKCFSLVDIIFEMTNSIKKSNNQKSLFETYFIKLCMFDKINNVDISSNVNNNSTVEMKPVINNNKVSITDNINSTNDRKQVLNDNMCADIDKNLLINNALAEANKELKKDFLSNFSKLESFYSNLEYSSIVGLLNKSIPEVVSNRNVLFVLKSSFEVVLFDKNIDTIKKLLKEIYHKNYSVVCVDLSSWKLIKEKYINDLKNGIIYKYIDEEQQITRKNNVSVLESDATSIFGDTVVSE